MIVNLVRTESSDEGTFGKFIVVDNVFVTAELPWEENERNVSCIPYGEYKCRWINSPKYGGVYQITNVKGRSHILIHWGNWAGSEYLGLKTDSDGCVLLGTERAVISDQSAIASSKAAIARFHEIMERKPFTLIVSGYTIW